MFINFRFGSVNSKTVGYMVSYQIHARSGESEWYPPYFALPCLEQCRNTWLIEIMIDAMLLQPKMLYSTNLLSEERFMGLQVLGPSMIPMQTASAIDELTKMFLLSKEVEQELEFSLRKSRAGRILILFM